MTTPPDGWRPQLEPAAWVTCRVRENSADGQAWLHAESADAASTDASLIIMAGWGGGGRYDHTEVVETEHAVHVLVFIEHWVPTVPEPGRMYVRTAELRRSIIEVRLAVPLGARTLSGSVGQSSTWGDMGLADSQPFDTVTSGPRAMASSQARDLIARFEEVQLIQATHQALADLQAEFAAKVPSDVSLSEELLAERREEARREDEQR